MKWQYHQLLDYMQNIYTSFQTDNHAQTADQPTVLKNLCKHSDSHQEKSAYHSFCLHPPLSPKGKCVAAFTLVLQHQYQHDSEQT